MVWNHELGSTGRDKSQCWECVKTTLTLQGIPWSAKKFSVSLDDSVCYYRFGWVKIKVSCNKSWRLRRKMECWASNLKITFCTTRMAEYSAPRAGCNLPPSPQEISWYPFLLEAEWKAGLLSAGRRNRSPEDFEGPYRKSSPESPVLWRSAQPGGFLK